MNAHQKTPWQDYLFRPLAIGVMVGCVAWSVTSLVHVFSPVGSPAYLTAVAVLVVLEAGYSYRLLQTSWRLRGSVLQFRTVELVMLFVLLKAAGYVGHPPADALADLRNWASDPSAIFDPLTLYAFFVALGAWITTTVTLDDLDRLGEPPDSHPTYVPPMESLSMRFFWGGAILLISAGFARTSTFDVFERLHPSASGLLLPTLLYFLFGLVMLGQVHLNELLKGWRAQELEVAGDTSRRWARYSLSFIGLAALLAFLSPTGYTVGLIETASLGIGLFNQIFGAILLLIFALFTFPVQLLLWLLSLLLGSPKEMPAFKLPDVTLTPPAPDKQGGSGWLTLLRSLLFWAVLLAVLFYVVRSYLRDHPEVGKSLAGLRPVRALRRLWAALSGWLWGGVTRLGRAVGERLPRRVTRPDLQEVARRAPFRFFRLGALSPRERILYYYLSILRRAGKRGYPRRGHQTPQEYTDGLKSGLPEAHHELDSLTEAFVEARYSRHAVKAERDRDVRPLWERVKAALRTLRRREEQER